MHLILSDSLIYSLQEWKSIILFYCKSYSKSPLIYQVKNAIFVSIVNLKIFYILFLGCVYGFKKQDCSIDICGLFKDCFSFSTFLVKIEIERVIKARDIFLWFLIFDNQKLLWFSFFEEKSKIKAFDTII